MNQCIYCQISHNILLAFNILWISSFPSPGKWVSWELSCNVNPSVHDSLCNLNQLGGRTLNCRTCFKSPCCQCPQWSVWMSGYLDLVQEPMPESFLLTGHNKAAKSKMWKMGGGPPSGLTCDYTNMSVIFLTATKCHSPLPTAALGSYPHMLP